MNEIVSLRTKNSQQILARYGFEAGTLVMSDGLVLSRLQPVRHVPNRRCVCHAIWQDQPVYAKLFFGKKAKHYALRDVVGVGYLQQAKIATPEILYHGNVPRSECYVVLFEAIAAENAEDRWQRLNELAQFNLAQNLVLTVAQHHNAGLIQTDMYLKNFLVQPRGQAKGELIWTLDGDGVRQFSVVSRQNALANLSVLLSKFDALMLENWLQKLLNIYAQARCWRINPDLIDMKSSINAYRRKLASAYAEKKVFRQCTDVQIIASREVFTAIATDYLVVALPQTPNQAEVYFISEHLIKKGNTCTVVAATLDTQKLIIKRYNIKSFWHGLNRAFRKTRAAISWANAHRLKLLGIATAAPIALIESRNWGLQGKAYFLAECVEAPDVAAFFMQTRDKVKRAAAVKQIVTLCYRLYLHQISHGDMKASNIKLLEGKPVLIDLDSMQQHHYAWLALRAHVRDLRRLMQNWQDEPALYNAFVKTFKVIYKDNTPLEMAHFQNLTLENKS
ncbi:MAG: lipopolysaccharide kinase InaA family protein [Methylophilaceae bacterium]